MASRQEEKERRRREREERLQAERAKASSRRRLQLVGAAVLGLAVVAAVLVAVLAGGGDGKAQTAAAVIPAQRISGLEQAAKAAGCQFRTFPSEGRTHLASDTATFNGYKTNPPTSGNHRPNYPQDGIFAAGNEPDKENWVHLLEHGRIIYQYKPGTPERRVQQLETLFNESFRGVAGYHQDLMQNNTNMPFQVAAVAWTHYVGCPQMNDRVFDAFRAFRQRFVDKGPELIP